jgi:hypothetical protein
MSTKADPQVSQLPDADMQAVPRALTRAAQRAREIAERTGTRLIFRDDVVEEKSRKDDSAE